MPYDEAMAGNVYEWFGYRAKDPSPTALASAAEQTCPFVGGACRKRDVGGVCSISPAESPAPVIICPSRLYFNRHQFLQEIAEDAFAGFAPRLDEKGLPALVAGSVALRSARDFSSVQIGVFGQGWDSEIRLPPSMDGGASYSVDFTLIAVSPEGDLLGFVPVEVQTIDTTNSYAKSVRALEDGRRIEPSSVGLNWENVSKRILPQLIVKGLMLQGEALCTRGIYFVTPDAVFHKIAKRLGGIGRLRTIPNQPGSITFVQYGYSTASSQAGQPTPLTILGKTTISTSDMSIAFISPQNLPESGSYELKIRKKLGSQKTATN